MFSAKFGGKPPFQSGNTRGIYVISDLVNYWQIIASKLYCRAWRAVQISAALDVLVERQYGRSLK